MIQQKTLYNEPELVDETATESMMKHELEQELSALFGDLTDNQRAALLLRVNEGLSYPEIGEVLGLSVQSVESLIFRARQQLRQSIQKMRA
jgi:RNA polymerase sigma-70 factor, ECF subfamily